MIQNVDKLMDVLGDSISSVLSAQISGTVNTAFGPMSTDVAEFISFLGKIGIGFGGVAAVGLLIAGGFSILTSTGEPEKLMNGREMITNALIGLALIVLALFVLQFLGWDVLGIGRLTGYDLGDPI